VRFYAFLFAPKLFSFYTPSHTNPFPRVFPLPMQPPVPDFFVTLGVSPFLFPWSLFRLSLRTIFYSHPFSSSLSFLLSWNVCQRRLPPMSISPFHPFFSYSHVPHSPSSSTLGLFLRPQLHIKPRSAGVFNMAVPYWPPFFSPTPFVKSGFARTVVCFPFRFF